MLLARKSATRPRRPPLTRSRFEARVARADDGEASEQDAQFGVDVGGEAVGSASLFGFDLFVVTPMPV